MKRCPKCEFIYEDDQSLCDMDGVLLVLDARKLPNHQALQTVPATENAPEAKPSGSGVRHRNSRSRPGSGLLRFYPSQSNAKQLHATTPSAASTTRTPFRRRNVNPTPEAQPPRSRKNRAKHTKPAAAAAAAGSS